jgi:mannose-6-phosphate isomerase
VQRVEGVVKHFAWGDTGFLPTLLGLEPDGLPWAELWLGTHANGESRLDDGTPLAEVTGELPYLLKVLAAAEPLSLQTHPNAAQAAEGFERGIYGDPNPKPELLCALTPFQALCGFRPVDATVELLRRIGVDVLADVLAADGTEATLAALLRGMITLDPIISACQENDVPEAEWVRKLALRYPGDPSVAATLLLNLVVLEPGQAIRLDAGNLHAYLHGAGIELMSPSDNVIRAGLTVKPVDVEQVLSTVDATPLHNPILEDGLRYELSDGSVALVRLGVGERHHAIGHELAIELNGTTWYLAPGDLYLPDEVTYVVTSP